MWIFLGLVLAFLLVLALIFWSGLRLPKDFEGAMDFGQGESPPLDPGNLEGFSHSPPPSSGGARPAQQHSAAPHPQDLPRLG